MSNIDSIVTSHQNAGRSIRSVDMYSVVNSTIGNLADGNHPNAEGYDAMADAWFDAIQSLDQYLESGICNPSAAPFVGKTFRFTEDMPSEYSENGTGWQDSSDTHRITNVAGDQALLCMTEIMKVEGLASVTLELSMEWTAHHTRDDATTVNIYDGDAGTLLQSLTVNQQLEATKKLGQFTFASGGPLLEVIGSGAGYAEAGPVTLEITAYTMNASPEPGSLSLGLAGLFSRRRWRR